MTFPLVSVVIPTFNRATLVRRAVESVLAQDYPAKEVVVVDDASTDETDAGTRPWAESHGVAWIRHENNRGRSAARNTGARASRGEFLVFLDSDDYLLAGRLSSHMRFFRENPEAMWVYSDYEVRDENGHPSADYRKLSTHPEGWIFDAVVLRRVSMPVMTVTMRRGLFREVGEFDPELPPCEDLDYWMRAAARHPIAYIPMPESVLVEHGHRSIRELGVSGVNAVWCRVLEKHAALPELSRDHRRLARREAARLRPMLDHFRAYEILMEGDMRGARVHAARAVRARPFFLKNYAYWLVSLFPAPLYTAVRRLKRFLIS